MTRKYDEELPNRDAAGEVRVVEASFSGPLPPPAALKRYDEVLPGAAERILALAESQHQHRQELEAGVIRANIAAQRLGVILGFILAMTIVLGGIVLIALGRPVSGLTAILSTMAGLIGTFVYGKQKQRKDLTEKNG